ncbi:MAG: DNA polymerase I [Actinomycetota bacterium]|nr:DNA polymerase I [Actinomycetota bacterium]
MAGATPPEGAPGRPEAGTGPLVLLDGMSLAFRSFFALPDDLATSAGVVTNAVHGFVSMLVNLVREYRPRGVAVAFDLPGGTFRDEVVPDYKGGRAATPEALLPQFDLIRGILASLAIPVVEAPGYEADDVLATLATEARDRGHPVVVVTGDRDAFQLVEDPLVRVVYNRRGVSDVVVYDEAGIRERTGVSPSDYPLLAALRGDPSDNLPGVPGVGEKTAARLVNEYRSLDELFAHLDALSPKLRENLATHEATVRRNAEVIPLVRDVPLGTDEADIAIGGWDEEEARRAFAELELRNSWQRAAELLHSGAFGPPRAGSGAGALGVKVHGIPDGVTDPSGWTWELAGTGGELARRLEELAGEARAAGVAVATAVAWSGDPGRSDPAAVALCVEGTTAAVVAHGEALVGDGGAREAFEGLVAASGPGVVSHGAKELMRWLLPRGVDMTGLVMDTSVASYLLDPSTDDYVLGDLARVHLGIELPGHPGAGRGQGSFDLGGGSGPGGVPEDLGAHIGRAAVATGLLRRRLTDALEEDGEWELHQEIELPLVRVLARMEVVGVRVDRTVLEGIAAEMAEECRTLEARIRALAGTDFNVNSVPQLRSVLYERLGLTPVRKTKTGYSTDARTLEQLRDQHPIVDTLLRYREVEKLRSTYGERLAAEIGPDGRIHATFNQTVARTGRLSSDRPNLHNIPVRSDDGRRLRRAFVPSEGCRLLVADYDQIELRAIAHLSGDPGLTSAFAAGQDIHRAVAARVFGVAPEDVTHAQRSTAKMVSYGLAYGMEAYGLSQRLAVPVEDAREILDSFFEAFPSVRSYMQEAVADARQAGYTVTAFGRRRPLPDLLSGSFQVRQAAERQAMNAGIQGLAADLFKLALVRLDAGLEDGGFASTVVLQVHDEVLVDVAADEAGEVESLVRGALEGAASLSVPLVVSMAWGDSWAEAKD